MIVNPHIVVQGADRAAGFYRDAFGAEELERIPTPDGRLMSVQLRIGETVLHVAEEFPEMGVLAPPSIGGSPVVLGLQVTDADAAFARALAAGAEARQPLADMFWGDRTARSKTRSAIAGTSPSVYTTCRATRSWPAPQGPSAETSARDHSSRLEGDDASAWSPGRV